MINSISADFVLSWGSIRRCKYFNENDCNGLGITETMMLYNGSEMYCTICYEELLQEHKIRCFPRVNDAKFKCPENNCDSKLFFHEFFNGKCCDKASKKNILENGLSTKNKYHRTELRDLKKMMNLLELSEQEEGRAKVKMDSKAKEHKLGITAFNEKKKAREQSRSNLASSLSNAGTNIAEDKEKTERAKLKELREMMDKHDKTMDEEEASEKKMEEDKKALDEATDEYLKKKEKQEQVKRDLSSSLIDTAKDLLNTEEEKEDQSYKCNVCFEKYNKIDRSSCALKCGHLTCQKCLNELPEKICPICRKSFTENDIIKIYLK